MTNEEDESNATSQADLEQQIYETLVWRGDIIPRSEQKVAWYEEGERFRECREGKAQTIANHEQYGDRERCHAASDGECNAPTCPQLRDGEPQKTGRHCPIDTWPDETEW